MLYVRTYRRLPTNICYIRDVFCPNLCYIQKCTMFEHMFTGKYAHTEICCLVSEIMIHMKLKCVMSEHMFRTNMRFVLSEKNVTYENV